METVPNPMQSVGCPGGGGVLDIIVSFCPRENGVGLEDIRVLA